MKCKWNDEKPREHAAALCIRNAVTSVKLLPVVCPCVARRETAREEELELGLCLSFGSMLISACAFSLQFSIAKKNDPRLHCPSPAIPGCVDWC